MNMKDGNCSCVDLRRLLSGYLLWVEIFITENGKYILIYPYLICDIRDGFFKTCIVGKNSNG